MGKARSDSRWAVALALLGLLTLAVPTRAADDAAPLRKKALRLNEVTGKDPMNGEVQALLDNAAGTRKLLAVAVDMAKGKNQPFTYNATLILGTVAEKMRNVPAAETFYRLHAKQAVQLLSEQGLVHAYTGLIQVYYNGKQYAKAEKACREFLGIEGDETIERLKPGVLRYLVLAIAKQGDVDRALGMIDKLMKAQPENWLTLALKGGVLREAGKLEDAVKVYEDVIARVRKDDRLKKDEQDLFIDEYRYNLSGLYIDLNQVNKAAEQLKALLAKEPANPTYNNDLGYIWADHDMNLAEAEKLIRKAMAEDRKLKQKANPGLDADQVKDTAAYLDSLGWVLFKQKKYAEARRHLEDAVKDPEGQHIEIYDHLGDVLQALGKKGPAIAAWKKGLEAAGPSLREQKRKTEVEKKIKQAE